ncbi:MAG: cytochrome C, partial [Gammaproteobacteria bacterium]
MSCKSLILVAPLALLSCSAFAQDQAPADTSEFHKALDLKPNLDNGREIYRSCATCHGPEGWGRPGGEYPVIAGQLRHVIIKQLIDIREGNRGNPMMLPFTDTRTLRSAQDIADVAEYIAQLPMTNQNETGPGFDLEHGKQLYQNNCVDCHGDRAEGDEKKAIPLLYGQHFGYLVRQFHWIQVGRRKNAD